MSDRFAKTSMTAHQLQFSVHHQPQPKQSASTAETTPTAVHPEIAQPHDTPQIAKTAPAVSAEKAPQKPTAKKIKTEMPTVPASKPKTTPTKTSSTALPMAIAAEQKKSTAEDKFNYLQILMTKVEQHKFYPRNARRRQIEGQVSVSLKLSAEGYVTELKIENGHAWLQKATRKAIMEAQPYPKPPASIVQMGAMRFAIAYQLTD